MNRKQKDLTPRAIVTMGIAVLAHSLADPGGRAGTRASPLGSISFIFMQFSAKIFSNNRFFAKGQGLAPLVWEILDPPVSFVACQS